MYQHRLDEFEASIGNKSRLFPYRIDKLLHCVVYQNNGNPYNNQYLGNWMTVIYPVPDQACYYVKSPCYSVPDQACYYVKSPPYSVMWTSTNTFTE